MQFSATPAHIRSVMPAASSSSLSSAATREAGVSSSAKIKEELALEKKIVELKLQILRLDEKRSERALAIISSHKRPVLSRHASELNMVLLPQESSSPCGSIPKPEKPSAPSPSDTPRVLFFGEKEMEKRIAIKFKLLENVLQQEQSTTDERPGSVDSNSLQGTDDSSDMAIWRAILQTRKSLAPALAKCQAHGVGRKSQQVCPLIRGEDEDKRDRNQDARGSTNIVNSSDPPLFCPHADPTLPRKA